MVTRATISNDCTQCTLRKDNFFCAFKEAASAELNHLKFTAAYPKGATLFCEGEDPRGVFIVCSGRVKLLTTSSNGRTLIVRIAGPGEILGLSAVILNQQYQLAAETLEPVQTTFIRRDEFMRFLMTNTEVSMRAARDLSTQLHHADADLRNIGLGRSVRDKFATLLGEWCESSGTKSADGVRLSVLLTHEEIAQLIGTTRETVTRLLSQFRSERLIEMRGATMIVRNLNALHAVA